MIDPLPRPAAGPIRVRVSLPGPCLVP